MEEILRKNSKKIMNLIRDIFDCEGDFRLFCIDIDDVIVDYAPWLEKQLAKIDYRATKDYRSKLAKEESEDYLDGVKESYKILNDILEETSPKYKELIKYEEFYKDPNNLYPNAIENINFLLKNRQKNDYFVLLSHRNSENERNIKIKQFLQYCPQIDGVLTLPFHDDRGEFNRKFQYVMNILQIPKEYAGNLILIDNTKKNVRDFMEHGGVGIRFLPKDYNDHYTFKDHLTKLQNLDPDYLSFVLAAIEYEKENPGYFDDFKGEMKILPRDDESEEFKKKK